MSKAISADGDDLLTYNALDTCATARVYREILRENDWSTKRVQRLHEVHVKLSKIGAELHTTGFLILPQVRAKLVRQLTTLKNQRHDKLVKHVGQKRSPGFRGTDGDMRALLYRRHAKDGIQCYDINEPEEWDKVMWTNDQANTLAVDKEALLRIFINPSTPEEVRDAIQLFWWAKAPGKALGTWVSPTNAKGELSQVQEHIHEDSRHRADWNSAGTETMRWASELMTIPEGKDEESLGGALPNIRAMYGCAKGNILYHWDWSQQELRINQAISGDKALLAAIKAGDVYTYDAHQWFPQQLERLFGPEWRTIKLKKEWPNGRRQCKVGHLAFQYMAGVPAGWTQALIQDRTIKFSVMATIHGLFHKVYHETIESHKAEHERVLACGYSEGRILHGRRYYPAPPPITESCNYPVQRTGGEMGALAMIGIWEAFKKYKIPAWILTNEHDAGTIECRDNATVRKDVAAIVLENVQGPWKVQGNRGTVQLTMPATGKFAQTWAEACAD